MFKILEKMSGLALQWTKRATGTISNGSTVMALSKFLIAYPFSSEKKDFDSRVAVVYEHFVVIIKILTKPGGNSRGKFITAYQADDSIGKTTQMPK